MFENETLMKKASWFPLGEVGGLDPLGDKGEWWEVIGLT